MSAAVTQNLPIVSQRSPQADLVFDARLGEQLNHAGINTAAANREELLALARTLAVYLATRDGTVHADKVQAALIEIGYKPEDLGNAAGALFAGPQWQWTGNWNRSARANAHRNMQRVWRLAVAEVQECR